MNQPFINIDDYDIIIEPFCGSSAISFNLWKNGNKNKIYILNDNDITIYELYTIMKKEEPDDILTEITKIRNGIPDIEAFTRLYMKNYILNFFINLVKECTHLHIHLQDHLTLLKNNKLLSTVSC
jgi:site-specific DNA-adenine methylase